MSNEFSRRIKTIVIITAAITALGSVFNTMLPRADYRANTWRFREEVVVAGTIGMDFGHMTRMSRSIVQGKHVWKNSLLLGPPLHYMLLWPMTFIKYQYAYILNSVLLTLAMVCALLLLVSACAKSFHTDSEDIETGLCILNALWPSVLLCLASYGFMFALERGNSDAYQALFSAMFIYSVVKWPQRVWIHALTISLAIHLKLTPLLFIPIILWKDGLKSVVPLAVINIALLFMTGYDNAYDFLKAYLQVGKTLHTESGPISHTAASFAGWTLRQAKVNIDIGYRACMLLPMLPWSIGALIMLKGGYTAPKAVFLYILTIPAMLVLPSTSYDYKLVLAYTTVPIIIYISSEFYLRTSNLRYMVALVLALLIAGLMSRSVQYPTHYWLTIKYPHIIALQWLAVALALCYCSNEYAKWFDWLNGGVLSHIRTWILRIWQYFTWATCIVAITVISTLYVVAATFGIPQQCTDPYVQTVSLLEQISESKDLADLTTFDRQLSRVLTDAAFCSTAIRLESAEPVLAICARLQKEQNNSAVARQLLYILRNRLNSYNWPVFEYALKQYAPIELYGEIVPQPEGLEKLGMRETMFASGESVRKFARFYERFGGSSAYLHYLCYVLENCEWMRGWAEQAIVNATLENVCIGTNDKSASIDCVIGVKDAKSYNLTYDDSLCGTKDDPVLIWGPADAKVSFEVRAAATNDYALYASYATEDPRPIDVYVNNVLVLENVCTNITMTHDVNSARRVLLGIIRLCPAVNTIELVKSRKSVQQFPHLKSIGVKVFIPITVAEADASDAYTNMELDRTLLGTSMQPILMGMRMTNAYVKFGIFVPETTNYSVNISYATRVGRSINMSVNGAPYTRIAVPGTSGNSVRHVRNLNIPNVKLNAGTNALCLSSSGAMPQVKAIAITR